MKKNKNIELSREQNEKLVTLALEERNPFEIIKKEFGFAEKEIVEIMKKRLTADKFELWKRKRWRLNPNRNRKELMILTKTWTGNTT